ncbi:MAG: DNA polymerase/3'-5' exonuclease PolX [Polyangiaceae bacterium]
MASGSHAGNRDVTDMLRELAELTMLEEGDPQSFRVRAYETAIHAIDAETRDITKLTPAELQKIDGIGKSTAAKIRELVEKGSVEKLEGLRAKHPRSIVALLQIQGLGPKAIAKLRAEHGITGLEDLERILSEQKLRVMKGFGVKTEEKLAKAVERFKKSGGDKRTPISVALPLAERIVDELRPVPGVVFAGYCGSLRRFSETIGDLDIVVATHDPGPVMEAVMALRVVANVLAQGDTKASFLTPRGMQVDVRVIAPEQLGAAMMYFTGSKGHNIKLRQRAIERGLILNEYALEETATKRIVARETEEEIYAALDLPWIHPAMREDAGEIELAEKGRLPTPIDPRAIVADLHVHTSLSGDGRSELDEIVRTARARGYKYLAITEHAEKLSMNGVGREALLEQRKKMAAIQREVAGDMKLLHGIELNIGPAGELDYDPEFRAAFDYCLASVHDHFDQDQAAQTQRIITAMRDPSVRMIGHLSARMIGGRPPIELDIDAVLAAAEETGTALEVNGSLPRLDISVDVLRRARGRAVPLVITSDAHKSDELAYVEYGCLNVTRAGVSSEQVVNAWSGDKFGAWAAEKRPLPAIGSSP